MLRRHLLIYFSLRDVTFYLNIPRYKDLQISTVTQTVRQNSFQHVEYPVFFKSIVFVLCPPEKVGMFFAIVLGKLWKLCYSGIHETLPFFRLWTGQSLKFTKVWDCMPHKRENPENPSKTHKEAGGDVPTHAYVSCLLNYYHSASAAFQWSSS